MKSIHTQLCDLLTAPRRIRRARGSWAVEENRLGTQLPKDYREFIEEFGAVRLCDWFEVFSPLTSNKFSSLTRAMASRYEYDWDARQQGFAPTPWDFYPAKGGLLWFAVTDNGDEFYWLTRGAPEEWSVVVSDRGTSKWHLIHGVGFSRFLLSILTGTCKEFSLPPECINEPIQIKSIDAPKPAAGKLASSETASVTAKGKSAGKGRKRGQGK